MVSQFSSCQVFYEGHSEGKNNSLTIDNLWKRGIIIQD